MRTSIHAKRCTMRQPSQVWPSPMPSSVFHSMAHKIGAQFHTIHGRISRILLPYVIRYNGTRPAKTAGLRPKYNYYRADEKCALQDIARGVVTSMPTQKKPLKLTQKAVYELSVNAVVSKWTSKHKASMKEWRNIRELASCLWRSMFTSQPTVFQW